MDRWNAAARAAGTAIDFNWPTYDQFPHPTFFHGTADAYTQYTAVLLFFFQQGDDFTFLANGHLFNTQLLNVLPSGQVGVNTTFKELATEFSSNTGGFANAPAATLQALAAYLAQMP
jgi:hypothetical protein